MRLPLIGKWVEQSNGTLLVQELYEAKTYFQRMVGLQFQPSWDENHGLLFKNCRAVHTMWMRFPLDVFFLDQQFQVVEFQLGIRPWRFVVARESHARHTIELASGPERNICLGATRIIPCSVSTEARE